MSIMKKVSLFIMCLIVLMVCFYNDKLISYADETTYNRNTLKDGMILKSGDYFSFNDGNSYSNCDGIQLSYEYNNVTYKASIDLKGNLTKPKSGYYRNSYERYKAFSQEEGKMPYVNGKTIYWEVEENSYYSPYYCQTGYKFVGHSYEEPSFNIYCDDAKIAVNDNTNCQVTIEYVHTPKTVTFDVESKGFEITNVSPGKGWKLVDNSNFTLEAIDIEKNKYLDSANEIDLIEFTINSKEKETLFDKEAIVVENIKWKDEIKSDEDNTSKEKVIQQMEVTEEEKNITTTIRTTTTTTTTKEKTTIENEKVENPKTGIKEYLIIYIVLGLLLISVFYELKKKDLFKKI